MPWIGKFLVYFRLIIIIGQHHQHNSSRWLIIFNLSNCMIHITFNFFFGVRVFWNVFGIHSSSLSLNIFRFTAWIVFTPWLCYIVDCRAIFNAYSTKINTQLRGRKKQQQHFVRVLFWSDFFVRCNEILKVSGSDINVFFAI